jgi:uncharacterized cupredoxin-like copper-binding protein
MSSAASLLACAAFVFTGCSDGTDGKPAQRGTGAGKNIVIRAANAGADFYFMPTTLKLKEPGVYTFILENRAADGEHALVIEGRGIRTSLKAISPGKVGRFRVRLRAGKYRMFCPIGKNREHGMYGAITVESPSR